MAGMLDRSFVCPVLIGRSAEIESIERAIQQVRQGRFAAVLVSGEAGIGKSRLAGEAIEAASAEGFRLLRGDCFERGRSLPFSAILEMLRAYLSGQDREAVEGDLGAGAGEIVKLVPELATLIPGLTATPALDTEEEKRRLFHALARFLSRAASTQPILLLIDDLHWSDDTTLEFLLFLCRFPAGPRDGISLLLLMTYRSDEVQPELAHFLAQLDRQRTATELHLNRLSMLETDVMIRAILELHRPVGRESLEALHQVTNGNPFFIEEVLKSLAAHPGPGIAKDEGRERLDWSAFDVSSVPRTVQDALRERTTGLSREARRLLELASACGMRFELDVLQEVTHEDARATLAQIRELLGAQLVIDEGGDKFAFRHALTRNAVYSQLLGIERREIHRRIGLALESVAARTPGKLEKHAGDLAFHFFEGEAWEKALEYSDMAAGQPGKLSTPKAVIQHLGRAVEAARRLSLPPSAQRLRRLGEACETAGDFDQALTNLHAALEVALANEEREEQWQALVDLGIVWSVRDYPKTGEYWRSALELSRSMGEQSLIAHSLNRVGNWHLNREQPVEAVQHHEEALRIFESIPDDSGIAETVDLLGMTWFIGANMIKSREYYERALKLAEPRDLMLYGSSLSTVSVCGPVYHTDTLVPSVTLAEGSEWLIRSRELAIEIGWRAGEAYALMCRGLCLASWGDYGQALDVTLEALAIAEDMGHLAWTTSALWTLGGIQMDLMDFATARSTLERAHAAAKETGSLHWTRVSAGHLARCYVAAGDVVRAEALLDETLDAGASFQTLGQRVIGTARAEIALAQNDPGSALRIVDALGESTGADAPAPPRLDGLRGNALVLLDDRQGAEKTYLRAAEQAKRQGQRGLEWRLQGALSGAYRRWGQRGPSHEHRETAEALIQDLARSLPDAGMSEAFRAAAVSSLPPAPQTTPARTARLAFGGLTVREREVARLIADGLSNADIADELVLSVRTVETHVSKILSKLDFTSRAQIAAWAVESGLRPA